MKIKILFIMLKIMAFFITTLFARLLTRVNNDW